MTHVRFSNRNCVPARAAHPASEAMLNWFWNDRDQEFRNTMAPMANIVETGSNYRIELVVPGFSKNDFRISLENQILTITGEAGNSDEASEERFVRREFSRKSFSRGFRLTTWIDSNSITAKYDYGILLVHIPKVEEAKAKPAREIEVG